MVLNFLKSQRACLLKKKVVSSMLLPKTKTSIALTYLRKKKLVAIFRSNKKVYWGVV